MNDRIFILLGSNLSDRLSNLAEAQLQISRQAGQIITVSPIYKTAAWGNTEQPAFYNQVIELHSTLTPAQLLNVLLNIETALGRIRKEKWEARIIDLDILLWGNHIVELEELTIPHPQMARRRFTLTPLCDIAPDFLHPVLDKTVQELLERCPDTLEVVKL